MSVRLFSRDLSGQAVQQHIEPVPGRGIALPKGRAGPPGKAAGCFRSICGSEFFEAFYEDFGEARRLDCRAAALVDLGAHAFSPLAMPRCSLAPEVIMCGVQGGS